LLALEHRPEGRRRRGRDRRWTGCSSRSACTGRAGSRPDRRGVPVTSTGVPGR
jgi:hypothetical protein